MMVKRKNNSLCWNSNSGHPAFSLIIILTELPQLCIFGVNIFMIGSSIVDILENSELHGFDHHAH
jgi:hypothetical protein